MNMEAFNRLLLESIGVGLAVVSAKNLELLYCNALFSTWFPLPEDGSRHLSGFLGIIDPATLQENDGHFSGEIQIKIKRRTLTIAITVSPGTGSGKDGAAYVIECHNISKVKELEYMIESYSRLVEKNERQLVREKERAEKLLLNVMPRTVYEELKDFGVTTPVRYDDVSVVMLDFVGFTEMTNNSDPTLLVSELNDIFTSFDRIVEQFGCERIKTMGDAYMAVSGLPEPTPEHAHNIAKSAMLFRRYIRERNRSANLAWNCRIGVATGRVIGSMVGVQKYVYDIFGPGVNMAARLEAQAQPMEILLCETTAELVAGEFRTEEAFVRDIKGFGKQRVFRMLQQSERVVRRDLPNYLQ